MKYLPNRQYPITYIYNCKKRNSHVDITTMGVKHMNLGSHESKIILGKTQCAGAPCEFMEDCEYINDARISTRSELLN